MIEAGTLLPDDALVQLREGSVSCTLCEGEKVITAERRRNHNRVAVPTQWVEQSDGKVREVEVPMDTLVECSQCHGRGRMVTTMQDLIEIEKTLMAYVHPKMKQIEVENNNGVKRIRVNRLTAIRDKDELYAKILEMHASEDGGHDVDDDSVVG